MKMRVSFVRAFPVLVLAFFAVGLGQVNFTQTGVLSLGPAHTFATGDGGGGEGADGWQNYTPYTPPAACTNGATNYPYCNNNVCTNGATNYPSCNNNVCTNGATNYPSCNNNHCTNGATNYPQCDNNHCTNGATNYPSCNNVCTNGYSNYPTCGPTTCSNGATNFPYCNNNVCTNGATNYPSCNNVCTNGYSNYPTCGPTTCSNGATNFPYCNNNVCTNGATNYPYCNNNNICTNGYSNYPTCGPTTCGNGCTNYPNCNSCPAGMVYQNGTCVTPYVPPVQTCSNGATNYPYCNNNVCTNGATNYPYCNNQYVPPTYVWCNGVQYTAPYTCPIYVPPAPTPCNICNPYTPPVVNTNLSVSTTGATPYITTATIYGYVNPYSTNSTIWFDYGTNGNLQWQTTRQSTSYAGQFSAALSGLTCGTRYYYRAAAQNSYSTKFGQTLSFVTQPCQQIVNNNSTVITRLATSVGYYSAQFNGTFITQSTNDRSCQAFFDYGTNYNLSKRTVGQALYNSSTVNYFSKAVSGLSPNTTYYYRAGVTCLGGTKFGNIVSFRTPAYVKKVVINTPKPVTTVTTTATCLCDTQTYISLLIENQENAATPGKTANFKVTFKNTSKETLQNVAIRIVLPDEMTIYSVDKGTFTKGSKTLTAAVGELPPQAEGFFTITTSVNAGTKLGTQMVVNGYADYTVPTVVKAGVPLKGEVTAYTLTVADTATLNNNNNGYVNNNVDVTSNSTTTGFWSWLPTDAFGWIIFILVFLVFISALRYVFSAFRSTN